MWWNRVAVLLLTFVDSTAADACRVRIFESLASIVFWQLQIIIINWCWNSLSRCPRNMQILIIWVIGNSQFCISTKNRSCLKCIPFPRSYFLCLQCWYAQRAVFIGDSATISIARSFARSRIDCCCIIEWWRCACTRSTSTTANNI